MKTPVLNSDEFKKKYPKLKKAFKDDALVFKEYYSLMEILTSKYKKYHWSILGEYQGLILSPYKIVVNEEPIVVEGTKAKDDMLKRKVNPKYYKQLSNKTV